MPAPSSPARVSLPLANASAADRRSEPRLSTEILGLDDDAQLSRGVSARVLNVSSRGALLELDQWIRPGTRTEIRLSRPLVDGESERVTAQGQVVRCWVHRLAPLRYQAALLFAGPALATPPDGSPSAEVDLTLLLEQSA